MDLWNTLAAAAPNANLPYVIGFTFFAVTAAALMLAERLRGQADVTTGIMALLLGILAGGLAGLVTVEVAYQTAEARATTAIEDHLLAAHDLRLLDPLDLDLADRTATAETVDEDGKRVTATLEWIALDTQTPGPTADDFHPLTVTLTTR